MNTPHDILAEHGDGRRHDGRIASCMGTLTAWAAAAAFATLAGGSAVAADGASTFKGACGPCHSTNLVHRIGPSLVGVVGRVSGTLPDFEYSPALRKAAVTWDAAVLERFLAAPNSVVAGTRMSYPGMKDEDKRKAIIEFIAGLRAP